MDLQTMQQAYVAEGYDELSAAAKTCQDVILMNIAASSLREHVTIKGGVVMHHISHDRRRATQDIDFDFIRYSLSEESIRQFIAKISNEKFHVEITGRIDDLQHQDYHGKRVYVIISDQQHHQIRTKIDIGVHKQLDIAQEEYCFDLAYLDEGPTLLINSKEQMFTEKLRSLLRIGRFSTRYKDIFDLYFLCNVVGMDSDKLRDCIRTLILADDSMREENFADICRRMDQTLKSREFLRGFKKARKNWLDVSGEVAIMTVLGYLESLAK